MTSTMLFRKLSTWNSRRFYAKSKSSRVSVNKTIEAVSNSLAQKGFLRSTKQYTPPENVSKTISDILQRLQIESISGENKFALLNKCYEEFNHSIPNSELHKISTIGDVIKFYETSVETTTPYDLLQKIELPENLHVQPDYIRFGNENESIFNGQTAFPKSSTLVTGLKYRNKYNGYLAKRIWP